MSLKRLPRFAFPPIKLNGENQQLALRFDKAHPEVHFFVKCPDCTHVIEMRAAADGDYGVIFEMLRTGPGRWTC